MGEGVQTSKSEVWFGSIPQLSYPVVRRTFIARKFTPRDNVQTREYITTLFSSDAMHFLYPSRIRVCFQSDGTQDSEWTLITLCMGIALSAVLLHLGPASCEISQRRRQFFGIFSPSVEIMNIECSYCLS
jgi:hypothetical protein